MCHTWFPWFDPHLLWDEGQYEMSTLVGSGLGWLETEACIPGGAYNHNLQDLHLNLTDPVM